MRPIKKALEFLNLDQHKTRVEGWFCQDSQCFIGIVSISVFDQEDYLIKSMSGVLNSEKPIKQLHLKGGCSIVTYESQTNVLKHKQIGIRNDNGDFYLSLVYAYSEGELNSIRICFAEQHIQKELNEALTLFKEIYAEELANAFASPLFAKHQSLTKKPVDTLSTEWILESMQQHKDVLDQSTTHKLERLDDPTADCTGVLNEQLTATSPRRSRQPGAFYRIYDMKFNDGCSISEGCETIAIEHYGMIKTMEYRKQTNTTTKEVWDLLLNKLDYENATQQIYQRRMIYSDGTPENKQGFLSFETNYIDDVIMDSLLEEESHETYAFWKHLKNITLRIVYYNEPVGARSIYLFHDSYCVRMDTHFDISRLGANAAKISTPVTVIDAYKKEDGCVEHTKIIKPSNQEEYQVQNSIFFRRNGTLFKTETQGTSKSGQDFKGHSSTTIPGANRTPSTLEYIDEPFLSQRECSPNDSSFEINWIYPKDGFALSNASQQQNPAEEQQNPTEEQQNPIDEQQEIPEQAIPEDTNKHRHKPMHIYLDKHWHPKNRLAHQHNNIVYNPQWNDNLYWPEDKERERVVKAVTDPLVKDLASRWTYSEKKATTAGARVHLRFTPAMFKENPRCMEYYRRRFLFENSLSQLAQTTPIIASDRQYQRFSVLKNQEEYASILDLSWAKGSERQAYQQPMHLIKMLRKQIRLDVDNPGFNCSFGSILLLLRLIAWVDVTLHRNKELPSSSLDVMQFFKSDDFMMFLCSLIESDQTIDLGSSGYSINSNAAQAVPEQLAKVICHLISIDDKPIHYFNYLSLLNGIGLAQTRHSELQRSEEDVDTFIDLLRPSLLYAKLRAAISSIDPQTSSAEQMLIFSLILGQIAHDSISKAFINKYNEKDNEFYHLIRFRHFVFHGRSFSCSELSATNGLLVRSEQLFHTINADECMATTQQQPR